MSPWWCLLPVVLFVAVVMLARRSGRQQKQIRQAGYQARDIYMSRRLDDLKAKPLTVAEWQTLQVIEAGMESDRWTA